MMGAFRERLVEAMAELRAGREALDRAATALEQAVEAHVQAGVRAGVQALPVCTTPVTEHRKAHRFGTVPKTERFPELQPFILAGLDRLTYHKIAAAIKDHFPATHHISHATVHRWAKAHADSIRNAL